MKFLKFILQIAEKEIVPSQKYLDKKVSVDQLCPLTQKLETSYESCLAVASLLYRLAISRTFL